MSPRKAAAPAGPEPRLTRRNHGRGHSYRIDGEKVPGVTTILNAVPKQLTKWAAEKAADHAVDNWTELAALPPSERHRRIMWAHREDVTSKGVRGTRVHALGERLVHGEAVEVPDDLRGPVEAYARALDFWQIEPRASETPVGSTRFGYAGTADLWGSIGKLGVELALIDLKTGKGLYESTALQLAGYLECDTWHPDGPSSEEPLPDVEEAYVLHILPDDVRLVPVDVSPRLRRGFHYVHEQHKLLAWLNDERPILDALVREDYR